MSGPAASGFGDARRPSKAEPGCAAAAVSPPDPPPRRPVTAPRGAYGTCRDGPPRPKRRPGSALRGSDRRIRWLSET